MMHWHFLKPLYTIKRNIVCQKLTASSPYSETYGDLECRITLCGYIMVKLRYLETPYLDI